MKKIKGRLCQVVNKFSFLELLFEVEYKRGTKQGLIDESYGFRTCLPIPYEKRFEDDKMQGYELNAYCEITLKKVEDAKN